MINKSYILATNANDVLYVLKIINNDEKDSTSLIDHPVLIGSRAAKWHIPLFRDPNDWDLMATIPQSISFINIIQFNAIFKYIKLIYYPGSGLKIVGKCIESSSFTDRNHGNLILFNIELVSDKVDFRKMNPNKKIDDLHYDVDDDDDDYDIEKENYNDEYDSYEYSSKESDDEDNDINSDKEDSSSDMEDSSSDIEDSISNEDNNNDDEDISIFESFEDTTRPKTSSLILLELCHDIKDKIIFPMMPSFLCIVAPLKILEALKSSHINYPSNFQKNITDLHILRVSLGYNKMLITQPLCSPQRDEPIELMLKTRIMETEIIQKAQVGLNMTNNEEFFDHNNKFSVQGCIPHDDIHELVKYGEHPIYESLKIDKSKTLIEKSLFEKIDYQTKLNCVKEEAMTIALERYLIPMVSKNQETSYNLALARICTTLSKGWFCQFAIDNYPKLSNLDKDLLSIAYDIIDKYPLEQKKQLPLMFDPETQAIFETIKPYTKEILSFDKIKFYNYSHYNDYEINRSGIKITSPVNRSVSITAIVTTLYMVYEEGEKHWSASVVILPSDELETKSDKNYNNDSDDKSDEFDDPLNIHPHYDLEKQKYFKLTLTSKNVFTFNSFEDLYTSIMAIRAKPADYVANKLKIPDVNGDLLYRYVLYYLNPSFDENSPLRNHIDNLVAEGNISNISVTQHPWYSAWNYTLKNKQLDMIYYL
ncbi:unnamed protein product [Rhizophagus irregularis]|uniref:Uncharacterized protein n=1 Tax=Rhizophagus irregularis TaxID=588596 RepID=A0A916E212_9GLOM|nr:unnamed protein product [Rhizophagus irregularis]CAB5350208.1 unnamed protein product [Rhizophagus irregularis]